MSSPCANERAHLSEPVDKYWLQDLTDLQTFLDTELRFGLDLAVEQAILNSDGAGENPTGILHTSGIQTQPFSTDPVETARKALTKLQTQGSTSRVFVVNPLEWETMRLLRSTTGAFLLTDTTAQDVTGGAVAPPTGAQALTSWGVPVVLSTALTQGTAVMMDPGGVTLYTDGAVQVEWNTATGFAANEVLARCEGRFGVAVTRPILTSRWTWPPPSRPPAPRTSPRPRCSSRSTRGPGSG